MNVGVRSLFCGLLGWLFLLPLMVAHAQVISMTLAFEVNSPYGLSEPWFTLRNGLLRHPQIESVAERPDRKARTGTITTRAGKLLDLDELKRTVRDSGAGATLRSVPEAKLEGTLIKRNGELFLKLPDAEIELRPPLEAVEKTAYDRLLKESSKRVRLSGPLEQQTVEGSRRFALEVRVLEPISEKLTAQQKL